MRVSPWILVLAVAALLVSGGGLLLGTQGLAGVEMVATGVKPVPAPGREAQARQPNPPAAAPAAPRRVETTEYDSWAVTCEDATVSGAMKKTCVALLRVVNDNKMLLNWEIGLNQEGRFVTTIQTPSALAVKQNDKMVGGPIMVSKGVELKFGNGAPRRLNYVWCGPQRCLAEAPIDEAFVKEALASAQATITVHTLGGSIPFDLSVKGIDHAISSTRK
jgi:invasion protein IalB